MAKFVELLKHNWIKIIVGIVVVFIILAVIRIFTSLFHCSNPICKGLSDAFGAGVNIIDGILSGCEYQKDCSVPTNKSDCLGAHGCSWSEDSTEKYSDNDEDPPTPSPPSPPSPPPGCYNNSGKAVGSGGPLNFNCLLFVGALIAAIATVLAGLFSVAKWYTSRDAKNTSIVTGEKVDKVMKDGRNNTLKELEKLKDKLKREGKGNLDKVSDEVSAKLTDAIGRDSMIRQIEESKSLSGTPQEIEQTVQTLKDARDQSLDTARKLSDQDRAEQEKEGKKGDDLPPKGEDIRIPRIS